jgi:branched-subunit amino acid aminotransferase/4-amino-4-deoxychorismate lyase
VVEVAERLVPVERRAVRRDELPRASEAFLTSVSREVMPVARIDDRPVGDGRPGAKTKAIMRAFAELVRREAETL